MMPRIVDQFHSLNHIGWYGSVYFLAICFVQPVLGLSSSTGKGNTFSFSLAFLCFEISCLICAIAPTSAAVIISRVVSGFGAAGCQRYVEVLLVNRQSDKEKKWLGIATIVQSLGGIVGIL